MKKRPGLAHFLKKHLRIKLLCGNTINCGQIYFILCVHISTDVEHFQLPFDDLSAANKNEISQS